MRQQTHKEIAWQASALTVLYFGLAWLTSALVTDAPSPAWFPAGLAVAALTVFDRRLWPAVWAATFGYLVLPVPVGAGWPAWVAALGGLVTSGQAHFASTVLRLWDFDPGMRRSRDVVGFFSVAVVASSALAATAGSLLLGLTGFATGAFWDSWWHLALGDALGIVLITPVLFAYLGARTPAWEKCGSWREAVLLSVVLIYTAVVVFGPGGFPITASWPFVLFPIALWAASRFHSRGVSLVILIAGGIAIWGTLSGTGPFASGDVAVDVGRMQLFMSVLAGTGLMLAAVVSEREAAVADLGRSERRFRAVVEQSHDGIYIGRPNGAVIVYNKAMERISGFTMREVSERGWFDCVYPDEETRAEAMRLADEAMSGVTSYLELPIRRKDGETRWISFSVSPVLIEGETFSLSILSDITERREAELERRMLHDVVQRSLNEIYLFDAETLRFTYANQAACDHLGYTFVRVMEMTPVDIKPEYDRAAFELLIGPLRSGEEEMIVFETIHERVDGSTYPVEVHLQMAATPTGDVFVAIANDITSRRTAEMAAEDYREHLESLVAERTARLENANEELAATNEELAATNEELAASGAELMRVNRELAEATRAKSDFLTSMSHELRTPLNSVIGFSDILVKGMAGSVNEEQQRQLAMIHGSGLHLLALVNDVLDLAKIEAGRLSVEPEKFDLSSEAGVLVDSIRPLAEAKGLELRTVMPKTIVIDADRRKVSQILLNLLSNAVKFTDSGAVSLVIHATAGTVELAVSDTGPGIEPADLERVFETFTQVDTVGRGRPEGTGLGLAVSRSLAEMLGGKLRVTSSRGEGSTFTLVLPRVIRV